MLPAFLCLSWLCDCDFDNLIWSRVVSREIQLLRRLNHRNVIRLIDTVYNQEKEKLYIFMEFCVCVLQELLESASDKKLPIWQAHR